MLKGEGFKLGVYDYFCKCINKSKKGVFLITDKQSIFYSQLDGEYYTHDEIRIEIETMIHPNKNLYGFDAINRNNIFIASLGHELLVEIPDGRLSYSQFLLFLNILKDLDRFNKSELSDKKVELLILKSGGTIYKSVDPNIDDVLFKLKKIIIHDVDLAEEKIIGKTLDEDTIIKCMKYQIDLENCECLEDLKISLSRCYKYYSDSYYKEYFCKLFKDYLTIRGLYYTISKKCDEYYPINDVTYDNLEDKLRELLNNLNAIKKI